MSKFTLIDLLGQKRADIFKFKVFVRNSPRNYEFLENSVFCQKRKENRILTKYSHCLTKSLCEKGRSPVNLRKFVCVVNNIQTTLICCFR